MSISVDEARFGDAGRYAAIASRRANLLDVIVKRFSLQNNKTEDFCDKVSPVQRTRKLALSAWKISVQPCAQTLILPDFQAGCPCDYLFSK